MKMIKKIIVIFFVLSSYTCVAQYDFLQINLEVNHSLKNDNHIRVSLYQQDSSKFVIGIKSFPVLKSEDYLTWVKRDFDTLIIIRKEDFNQIAEMSMSLSSSKILKGTNPSNAMVGNDGITVNLELVVTMDKVSYSIWCPMYNTNERNLKSFLAICNKVLLLAKLKPKEILK
jgi:hypothetical protein